MASPVVGRYNTESLVTKFLHNAQTSRYLLYFKPPGSVISHIARTKGVYWNELIERVNISCISAKLPASSFATHDKNFRTTSRMSYPNGPSGYRTNAIDIIKFDRDLDNSIKYSFVEGFPTSMDAMEISYGESDVLRLNVNFNFVRYVTEPYVDVSGTKITEKFYSLNFLNDAQGFQTTSQNIA